MRQISTVIEIGTSKVVSIISEAGQFEDNHILGSATVPYPGYKNRKWVDKRKVAPAIIKSLHEAERIAGRHNKTVHVGIPADFTTVICKRISAEFNNYKTITQDDIDELFQKCRSKLDVSKDYMLIHRCPVVFILDGARRTMEPTGRKAKSISAIISYVLAEKWFVNGMKKILENNGYSASTFISSSYAQAIRFIPEETRDHGAVLIDFGGTSTTVLAAHGDGIIFHKALPFGGDSITSDLQQLFGITYEIASELKKRSIFGLSLSEDDTYEVCKKDSYKFVKFSAIEVQQVIEARLDEMLRIIVQMLDKSRCNLPGYIPVYITGGTASIRGIREYIQKQINHNTQIIVPCSTCFNQPAFSAALAVMDLAAEAESDDDSSFFDIFKNFFRK